MSWFGSSIEGSEAIYAIESGDCEALRQTCQAWWSDHKAGLIAQVSRDLTEAQ